MLNSVVLLFQVSQSHVLVNVSEGDIEPVEIKVQLTIPVLRDNGKEVILALEQKDDKGNVIMSACDLKFNIDVTKSSFKIHVKKDKVYTQNYQMHVNFTVQKTGGSLDAWDNHEILQPIKVRLGMT